MLVLDTDHLVEFDRGSATGAALRRRLEEAGDEVVTTIISAEEQFRGWLAQIHRQHDPYEQIVAYHRLQRRIDFFAAWYILPWNTAAADILQDLRRRRVRIGTMDLKIAIDFQEMFREASMPLCPLARASHSSGPSAP